MARHIHITYLPASNQLVAQEEEAARIRKALAKTMQDLGIKKFAMAPEDLIADTAKLNSMLTYFVVDENGFKTWNSETLVGRLSEDQIETILSCLLEGEYFNPDAIGLPNMESTFVGIHAEGFSLTSREASVNITPDELVERFLQEKKTLNQVENS